MNPYQATSDALTDRIRKLIPKHPEILEMTEPWALLKVEEFNCDDLNPSLAQASWALRHAKQLGPL